MDEEKKNSARMLARADLDTFQSNGRYNEQQAVLKKI